MNKKNINFLSNMNIKKNCIIINQTDYNEKFNFKNNIKFICTNQRGLSRSRNMAIENCDADICLFADDDLKYVDNYEEKILREFEKNNDIDILCFCVEGINKKFKNYSNREKRLNFFTSMKVSSVEIAFKKNKIVEKNIKFKEYFGAGSQVYSMGEENIFLADCIKNKLKIKFVPVKIADLYIGNSTWFNGFNDKYFFDRGAVFSAMNNRLSYLLIIQFAIRKYKLYSSQNSFINALKKMLEGKFDYKKKYLKNNFRSKYFV